MEVKTQGNNSKLKEKTQNSRKKLNLWGAVSPPVSPCGVIKKSLTKRSLLGIYAIFWTFFANFWIFLPIFEIFEVFWNFIFIFTFFFWGGVTFYFYWLRDLQSKFVLPGWSFTKKSLLPASWSFTAWLKVNPKMKCYCLPEGFTSKMKFY